MNNPWADVFPPSNHFSVFYEMQLIRSRIQPFGKINWSFEKLTEVIGNVKFLEAKF